MFKKILLSLIGLLVVAIGYYFISPFFISVHLDEAEPEEVAPSSANVPPSVTNNQIKGENVGQETVTSVSAEPQNEDDSTLKKNSLSNPPPSVPSAQTAASIVDTPGHKASGAVRLIKTATGDVVRFENFKTVNGPDLFVYLATDLEATEYVDLGRMKATEGNVNYVVPEGTSARDYQYVMVWCKQFGVLFSYADISRL